MTRLRPGLAPGPVPAGPAGRMMFARSAAWFLWSLLAASFVAGLFIGRSNGDPPDPIQTLALLALPTAGAIIATARPRNPIGWLLLLLSLPFNPLLPQYAIYGLVTEPGSVPGALAAAWLTDLWFAFLDCLIFIFLLFPDGKLPSRRWRPVAWATAIHLLLFAAAGVVGPNLGLDGLGDVANPTALPAGSPIVTALDALDLFGAMLGLLAAGALALVTRFRRADHETRLQLKGVLYAIVFIVVAALIDEAVLPALGTRSVIADVAVAVGMVVLLPAAIVVSVLRYRLYDIDRIVSRTVSYGLLTAALAGIYVTGVIGIGGAFRALTGDRGNELVVAASTLAVAAAFGPLRRRIRDTVDRRFDRARYDAARTAEVFAQRLRGELDLDALRAELAATVTATVAPRGVSVWVRR